MKYEIRTIHAYIIKEDALITVIYYELDIQVSDLSWRALAEMRILPMACDRPEKVPSNRYCEKARGGNVSHRGICIRHSYGSPRRH